MDGESWRWGGSNVLYCFVRSSPCFSCSENWFGNSPINIDEAMTNGNYGLTGQKLPLGKFESITIPFILECKVHAIVSLIIGILYTSSFIIFSLISLYSSAPIQKQKIILYAFMGGKKSSNNNHVTVLPVFMRHLKF